MHQTITFRPTTRKTLETRDDKRAGTMVEANKEDLQMICISHTLFQDWTVNHKHGSTTMAGIPTTAEPHHRTPRSPESNQQDGVGFRQEDMPPSGPHFAPQPSHESRNAAHQPAA